MIKSMLLSVVLGLLASVHSEINKKSYISSGANSAFDMFNVDHELAYFWIIFLYINLVIN